MRQSSLLLINSWLRVLTSVGAVVLWGCSSEAQRTRIEEKADRYFEAGQFDEAKIEYSNLNREDPRNVHALTRLGTIAFDQGAPSQALPFLQRAATLSPDSIEVRVRLGQTLNLLGHPEEARDTAEGVVEHAPYNDDALQLLAETVITVEQLETTQQRLNEIVESGRETGTVHMALATLAFKKRDLKGVEDEIDKALRCDPESPSAHAAKGNLLAARGEMENAADALKTAASLAPMRSLIRLKYPEFKLENGDLAGARKLLEEYTQEVPDSLPAWWLFARVAFKEAKYDEALAHLDNIFSRDPVYLTGWILKIQIQMANGDEEKALEKLKQLQEVYPRNPDIQFLLAKAHLLSSNPRSVTAATAALNQTISLQPNHMEAILLLAKLNLREGNAGDVVTALEPLMSSGLAQVKTLLADAYRASGRLDKAIAIFDSEPDTAPNYETCIFRGMLLRQQGKIQEARDCFAQAEALSPDNSLPVFQLAELDLLDGAHARALERITGQLSKTPDSAAGHYLQGRIFSDQDNWNKAEEALLKAVELEPNFFHAYGLLVKTYIGSGKLPEALAQLETLVERNPSDLSALMRMAHIQEKLGQLHKAKETYETILSLAPNSAPTQNNLAVLYAEEFDDLQKAYELAQSARSLLPESGYIADTLGWIVYKQNDFSRALVLLSEAVASTPQNARIQFHYGMASYRMGHADQARQALQNALSLESDFTGHELARQHLALLTEGTASNTLTVAELEALSEKQPSDPSVLMKLTKLYEEQGEFGKIADRTRRALEANPNLLSAAMKLAELYAGPLQDDETALHFAEKAHEIAPENPIVSGMLGKIEYAAGDLDRAYVLFRESIKQPDVEPVVLCEFATCAYAVGDLPGAKASLKRVGNSDQESDPAYTSGSLLALLGALEQGTDLAAVEEIAQNLIQKAPHHLIARMVEAGALLERGDSQAAEASYRAILERRPDFAPAQKGLAVLYAADADRLDDARSLALKARTAMPNDTQLTKILAEISYQLKDYSYARQLLLEVARSKPLDGSGQYLLAMAGIELNEPSGYELLQQALDLGLTEPLAANARKALKQVTVAATVNTQAAADPTPDESPALAQSPAALAATRETQQEESPLEIAAVQEQPVSPLQRPDAEGIDVAQVPAQESPIQPSSSPEIPVAPETSVASNLAIPRVPAAGPITATLKLIKKPSVELSDGASGNVLGVFEYELVELDSGTDPGSRILIVDGVIWNGKILRSVNRDLGSTLSLDLVPLTTYPNLFKLKIVGGDPSGAYTPKQ
ncbi:MAG: tetratricopeptide repeat protein [Verrucomicrobiales bacterium]